MTAKARRFLALSALLAFLAPDASASEKAPKRAPISHETPPPHSAPAPILKGPGAGERRPPILAPGISAPAPARPAEAAKPDAAPAILQAEEAAGAFSARDNRGDEGAGGGLVFTGGRAQKGEIRLGTLADPAGALGGKIFGLTNRWEFLSFHHAAQEGKILGAPLISGKPASESPLEFKESVRRTSAGVERRDYVFLALGATPPGRYEVEFPGFSFAIEVAQRQNGEEISRAVPPEAVPAIAPETHPEVRRFLESHLSALSRHLPRYARYVREDDALDEPRRNGLLAELEKVRQALREAAEGRRPERSPAGVVAHLEIAESAVLERYKTYLRLDPADGREAAEAGVKIMEHYQDLVRKYREAIAGVDFERPVGLIERAARALLTVRHWSVRARLWILTHPALRGTLKPSSAVHSKKELPFGKEVEAPVRAFLSKASDALESIVKDEALYIERETGLSGEAKRAKQDRMNALSAFLVDRVSGRGFSWTVPAIATRLISLGGLELLSEYRTHLLTDPSLDPKNLRAKIKDAAEFKSLLRAAAQPR